MLFDDDEEDSAADDNDNELRIRHEFSGPAGSKVSSSLCCVHHHHHHHHFWLAPLRVRSATHSQQPPEWAILSHIDSFSVSMRLAPL